MKKNRIAQKMTLVCLLLSMFRVAAQDAQLGQRAEWMKGALGMLWLPDRFANGNIEGVRMDDFLDQIDDLRTVDFVQVALSPPFIYSPSQSAPHPILESLWEGDMKNGEPINLVVPRASVDDPFLAWLKAIKAKGLRTEIYVNSTNLLPFLGQEAPEDFPDFSERWIEYCNTNRTVRNFINSKSYHRNGTHDNRRPYMFAYAEFILKEYAVRYGDLIDAWCFDAARVNIEDGAGDNSTGTIDEQRVYEAFANAVHAGNPNAAVAFNNGLGRQNGNPYSSPSFFEDYKFGHPFGGAGNMVEPRNPLYGANFGICEFMRDTNGHPYRDNNDNFDDNVVAHFFPKQSTTSWAAGATPCLTDAEFVEWNNVGLINGGGITWGTPLVVRNLNNRNPQLTLQPYALRQFEGVERDLRENQFPGAPNWARQFTILPNAEAGKAYSHTLFEDYDFWDPEGDNITQVEVLSADNPPSWLEIVQLTNGRWRLTGTPTEARDTEYTFRLRVRDASGGTNREVTLNVKGDGNNDIAISNIEFVPMSLRIDAGATRQVDFSVSPTNTNEAITWSSSDTTIARVNNNGLITGVSEGRTTITATNTNGQISDSLTAIIAASEDQEVESVNLALNGVATQSTTTNEGVASLAIDGNTNGEFNAGSVTHTANRENSWFEVNLGAEYPIGDINIFGRTDACCASRLSNYKVSVIDNSGATVFSESSNVYPTNSINAGDNLGSIVRIQLNGTGALSLAEIQVMEGVVSVNNDNDIGSGNIVHITNRNNPGFALDGGNGGANGQDLYLWGANQNNQNQQWVEIDRGNGFYTYQKAGTNFCIDGNGGGATAQNVYLWTCSDNNQNQHWKKVATTGGSFRLEKRNSAAFSIDAAGTNADNGQSVYLWSSNNNNANQQWFISPVGSAKSVVANVATDDTIVYPNPVVNTATIQGAANTTISIFDISGQQLLDKEIATDSEEIDLRALPTGIYYGKVVGVQSISVIKIVKK